jgi:uncharacterized protein
MMQQNALIVFTRRAELGKVKTRIAATLGNDKALEIYVQLLHYTQQICKEINASVQVFTTGNGSDELWNGFAIHEQREGDLGERMQQAFATVLALGYENIVIIGSDCLQLTSTIINNAFEKLHNHDTVIGAAEDGGYYLLGMKKIHALLFANKQWGTNTVYAATMQNIRQLQLSCYQLPMLNDVDEAADVPSEWL